MVKINLLPDLRQAKLHEQHRRQLAVSLGVLVCIIVIGVLVVMLAIGVTQKLQISSLTSRINSRQSQLEGISGLTTALTAQQTLNNLPSLYSQRVYFSHLLAVLATLQPSTLSVSNISDSTAGVVTLSGNASNYTTVALFAKALATGTPNTAQYDKEGSPFSSVTIASVSEGQGTSGVTFSLNATVSSQVLSNGQ